jgi:hypothetical protein
VATAASEEPTAQFLESLVSFSSNKNGASLFRGYYFRVVKESSADNGKSRRDLTLIAYPAHYRESGVMTFFVTQQGAIDETDLGPNTATVAPKLNSRSGTTWHPAA